MFVVPFNWTNWVGWTKSYNRKAIKEAEGGQEVHSIFPHVLKLDSNALPSWCFSRGVETFSTRKSGLLVLFCDPS